MRQIWVTDPDKKSHQTVGEKEAIAYTQVIPSYGNGINASEYPGLGLYESGASRRTFGDGHTEKTRRRRTGRTPQGPM